MWYIVNMHILKAACDKIHTMQSLDWQLSSAAVCAQQ